MEGRKNVDFWKVFGNCLDGVWRVSGGCLVGVWWGVWKVPGRCLEGIYGMSECYVGVGCLDVSEGQPGAGEVRTGKVRTG